MESSVMGTPDLGPLLSGALVVVSLAILASMCVSCRKSSNRAFIQQNFGEDDYVPQLHSTGGFRVVRPTYDDDDDTTAGTVNTHSAPPVCTLGSGRSSKLSYPQCPSPHQDTNRRPSFNMTTDRASVLSCQNSDSDQEIEYVNEDNDNDDYEKAAGYIEVLPDPPANSFGGYSPSLLSTQSSGHDNYVNVTDEQSDNNSEYINMMEDDLVGLTPGASQESVDSGSDYVNTKKLCDNPDSMLRRY